MKRIAEVLRVVFISPEFLAGSIPFAISSYWPEPANFAAQLLASDTKWALGMAAIPIGLLVGTYGFASDVLSLSGAKKAILAWPDYWKLKMRVLVALGYCIVGFGFVIGGVYSVAHHRLVWGATTAISGALCAAGAIASVALARWTIREICPD